MKRITSWLNTPYYFNPSIKFKFKTSLTLAVFVFVFLYIFKPFSLISLGSYLLEYTSAIGVFTFFGTLLILYIPPLVFPDFFNEDKWTVGKNILLIFFGIFFLGSVLWYCASNYKSNRGLKQISLVLFLFYTFLVGAIPVFFLVYLNERNLRRKRIKKVQEIRNHKKKKLLEKSKNLKSKTIIYSDNKKESLSFNIENLVYITSQGNYASFFIKSENNILKEKILRVTLAKIESELEVNSKVIRCHKSYIINTKYISDISGNARGYLLKSNIISFDIPVSRSFSKQSLMSFLD